LRTLPVPTQLEIKRLMLEQLAANTIELHQRINDRRSNDVRQEKRVALREKLVEEISRREIKRQRSVLKSLRKELLGRQEKRVALREKLVEEISRRNEEIKRQRSVLKSLRKERLGRQEKRVALREKLVEEISRRNEETKRQRSVLKSLRKERLGRNPVTKKELPLDLRRRLASLSRRNERITRFETRVRSDILLIVGNHNTPCKAIGNLKREGITGVEESLFALAHAHRDAGENGDGTKFFTPSVETIDKAKLTRGEARGRKIANEGTAFRPWGGRVLTIVNQGSNCAFNIADMIFLFASNPQRIQSVVQLYREKNQVKVAGEIVITYRIIYRKKTRLGVLKEQYEAPSFFKTRRFILGIPIKRKRQPTDE